MKLYVIRHGEVDVNVQELVNSHNDSTLTQNGIKQAIRAREEIKDLKIDLIICSPLARTVETCNYININQIEVIYDERIVERNARSMQYEPIKNIDLDLWYDRSKETIYKDTEGFKSLLSRISSFLEEIKEKYNGKNVLLVTHGDVCKAIYVYFNPDILDKDIFKYKTKNCGLLEFEI